MSGKAVEDLRLLTFSFLFKLGLLELDTDDIAHTTDFVAIIWFGL